MKGPLKLLAFLRCFGVSPAIGNYPAIDWNRTPSEDKCLKITFFKHEYQIRERVMSKISEFITESKFTPEVIAAIVLLGLFIDVFGFGVWVGLPN